MIFAMRCVDVEDGPRIRQEHLKAHLAYIDTVIQHIKVAGPLLTGPGGSNGGSLLILDLEDEAAARGFVENDPYYKAGLWREVSAEAFRPVAGDWFGGKAW